MNIRRINENDYLGIFNLLNQLTDSPTLDNDKFNDIISQSNKLIYVVEIDNVIIATATLLIDTKLTRGDSNIGYIEEVVTDKNYRNKGISKQLLQYIIDVAKQYKCYKLILTCNDDLINFYTSVGFNTRQNSMIKYINLMDK